jgi:translation initiation factor 1A
MVALREFQDEKCDVVLKYFPEEVKQLKNLKEIPEVGVYSYRRTSK